MSNPLTFGSLFAGIGGFDLGFERAGMVCQWQVEKDPFCQKILAKHWPNVEKFEDVKDVGKHNLKPVDVICGGFPCQPHSTAGKRRGAADDRDLWPEYRRIIAELRPAWVIGENVPGIRTTILDQVLFDLEDLAYATATFVIPACAVNAPHRRDRVFIVAHSQHQRRDDRGNGNRGGDKIYGGIAQKDDRGQEWLQPDPRQDGEVIPNTSKFGRNERKIEGSEKYKREREQQARGCHSIKRPIEWEVFEPGICRTSDGVPNRVDRIRGLGNAVVPQVAEFIAGLVIAAT